MKIIKNKGELLESRIFESEENPEVLDPSDSIEELTSDVIDQVEADSAGGSTLSKASASTIAAEIKSVGTEIDADAAAVAIPEVEEGIGVENRMTKVLDLAFAKSKKNKKRGAKSGFNVLIVGLPGSGKTASIEDWARSNGVNLVAINAKNNDLEAYINGYTTKHPDNPLKVTQAFSDNLDELDKENSVLFLDEYNRQVKQNIRASLYHLINEHKIVGDGPGRQREFKNMLFTIAAINPAVKSDKGATALNDAEASRFWWTLDDMDSDPATTLEFLTKYYNLQINKLNPADELYREDLEDYLRIQDLGIFIVSHPKFFYDGRDDLEDLNMYSPDGKKPNLLCQRSLTQGLHNSDGDVTEFKFWVENGAKFLARDTDMLLSIIKEYINPTFEDLCAGHGIDLGAATPPHVATKDLADKTTTDATVGVGDSDLEDDDDFFVSSGLAGKVRAKNPYEVEMAIAAALKDW